MLEVLLVLLHMANHTSKGLLVRDRCIRVHLKVLNPCHVHATLNWLIEPCEMHVEKWELGCASLSNGYSFLEIQDTPRTPCLPLFVGQLKFESGKPSIALR